jgi:hypothetical protein
MMENAYLVMQTVSSVLTQLTSAPSAQTQLTEFGMDIAFQFVLTTTFLIQPADSANLT